MADAVRANWSGRHVVLTRQAVLDAAAGLPPDVAIRDHAVSISGRAYPPKAIVAKATGLSTHDFNAAQARRLLGELGFETFRAHDSGRSLTSKTGPADEVDDLPDEDAATFGPILEQLRSLGTALGFHVESEVRTAVARLDQVWSFALSRELAGFPARVPVIAIEVESSWRTRKHIKGDILNLSTSGAGQGLLVICGTGTKLDQLREAAVRFIEALGLGGRIHVWSHRDVARACR